MSKATHSNSGKTIPNTNIPETDTKLNIEDLAVTDNVKSLKGKKPNAHGNSAGLVRLRNIETNQIITGFIPVHLAQMQTKNNPNIEIINDAEEKG